MANTVAREIADMAWDGYTDAEIREECEARAAEAGVTARELYRASEAIYAHVYEGDDGVTMVD
jgi:hypothetical protein